MRPIDHCLFLPRVAKYTNEPGTGMELDVVSQEAQMDGERACQQMSIAKRAKVVDETLTNYAFS